MKSSYFHSLKITNIMMALLTSGQWLVTTASFGLMIIWWWVKVNSAKTRERGSCDQICDFRSAHFLLNFRMAKIRIMKFPHENHWWQMIDEDMVDSQQNPHQMLTANFKLLIIWWWENWTVPRLERGSYDQICDLRSAHFAKSQALDFAMMNNFQ